MYAVIRTGGKQYRVAEGETLRVEKLDGPAGTKLTFESLLLPGVTVEAEILEQGRHKKIVLFKYKRRKSYRRKGGHRQPFTALKITGIKAA